MYFRQLYFFGFYLALPVVIGDLYNACMLVCMPLITYSFGCFAPYLLPCLFISSPMLVRLMLVCFHLSVSPVVLSYHPDCPFITASRSQQSTPFAVSIFTLFGWRCPSAPLQMYCHPFGVPYRYRVRFPSVADAKIQPKTYAKQIFSVNKC